MGEFIFDYGIFLAKAVTVVLSVAAILILIAAFTRRAPSRTGLVVEKLNDKYRQMSAILQQAVLNKAAWKKQEKEDKKKRKKEAKAATADDHRKRTFVLDFKGDIRASGVAHLREEISAVVRPAN